MSLALQLIESMTDKFTPKKYKDEYQDRIKDAIEDKLAGNKVKKVKGKPRKSVNDLMEALEASLKGKK